MSMISMKVPAPVVSGIICFCLGIGIMYGIQVIFYQTDAQAAATPDKADVAGKDPSGGSPKAKGKGGGGMGGGPNPKTQLAQLVTKLDVLTVKPLKFELTGEQKKQVKEILADLDSKEAITDEEAKTKL